MAGYAHHVASQKRNRRLMRMARLLFTDVTWPNWVELTSVLIPAKFMVLRRLLAVTLIDIVRVPPRGTSRMNVAFRRCDPGPVMTLRPEVPNVPGAGMAKALTLKNWSFVG